MQAVGYDGVWSTEVAREPFFPLLLAAEYDENLTVGTGIAVAFARSPLTMAAAAYEVQAFSRGRFVLGMGSQVRAHIERRFSMPWSEPLGAWLQGLPQGACRWSRCRARRAGRARGQLPLPVRGRTS